MRGVGRQRQKKQGPNLGCYGHRNSCLCRREPLCTHQKLITPAFNILSVSYQVGSLRRCLQTTDRTRAPLVSIRLYYMRNLGATMTITVVMVIVIAMTVTVTCDDDNYDEASNNSF